MKEQFSQRRASKRSKTTQYNIMALEHPSDTGYVAKLKTERHIHSCHLLLSFAQPFAVMFYPKHW